LIGSRVEGSPWKDKPTGAESLHINGGILNRMKKSVRV